MIQKIVVIIVLIFVACNGAKKGLKTSEAIKKVQQKVKVMEECLSEYKDIKALKAVSGEIVEAAGFNMIAYDNSSRVHPCNLDDTFIVGTKVVFSGWIKESPPNVRLAGTPFRLTKITKL